LGEVVSIIEQATKRLEQLRRAGVELPWEQLGVSATTTVAAGSEGTTLVARKNHERVRHDGDAPGATGRSSRSIQLDPERLRKAGLLAPGIELSELAAEFRAIKRPLVANLGAEIDAASEGRNLIVVTSALAGEGKTFCSINLALSMAAEVDRTVLLVDADVLKPSIADVLGFDAPRGLLDLLASPATTELSDVLLRTNIPKFTILPAGVPRGNSAELLAGARMKALFDDLSSRYSDRIVIVDAPPLLPTSEARTLASRAGQVLMVVDAGHATQNVIGEAFALIEGCDQVMSVLNRRSAMLRTHGNSYGYGE
jgi:protein-tyrosine kinase